MCAFSQNKKVYQFSTTFVPVFPKKNAVNNVFFMSYSRIGLKIYRNPSKTIFLVVLAREVGENQATFCGIRRTVKERPTGVLMGYGDAKKG